MLRKEFLGNGSSRVCRTTFILPSSIWANTIHLVGDFNGWNQRSHPFQVRADGSWAITLDLKCGQTYQFRYLIDGKDWITDYQSDAAVANEYGSENSILSTFPPPEAAEQPPA